VAAAGARSFGEKKRMEKESSCTSAVTRLAGEESRSGERGPGDAGGVSYCGFVNCWVSILEEPTIFDSPDAPHVYNDLHCKKSS
jgi:hypothetical protein